MKTPPSYTTCLTLIGVALLALGINEFHRQHWLEGAYGFLTGSWAVFLVYKWYRS